jgi:hypothetical protein
MSRLISLFVQAAQTFNVNCEYQEHLLPLSHRAKPYCAMRIDASSTQPRIVRKKKASASFFEKKEAKKLLLRGALATARPGSAGAKVLGLA